MKKRKSLGIAFKDSLLRVNNQIKHFKKGNQQEDNWQDQFIPNYKTELEQVNISTWRLVAVCSVFLIALTILILRLFHLQIVYGSENHLLADSNRIHIKVIHAPRGVVYDRNGNILAENNPGFRLKGRFLTRDQTLELEAKNDPEFVDIEIDAMRSYLHGPITAHILGYVGEISEEELKKEQFKNYRPGDRIGRAGIEQQYESALRGKDGAEVIEVDAIGQKLRTIRRIDPVPGKNIHLSIDLDLQKTTYQALQKYLDQSKSCCGAAVAQDPQSGHILTLVSLPSYEPNAFTDPSKNDLVTTFFQNADSPLMNRVISGTYPPASTFKIASSLAGLASGKITKDTKFEDTGIMYLGPYSFSNWFYTMRGGTDGQVDLVKGLQRSNDIYYYKLGQIVGEQVIADTAKKLGLGRKLGIDLPGEVTGIVPDDAWKRNAIGEVWYPGDTLHFVIGQGFLLTTPLQILSMTSFIASDGILFKPLIVTKITAPDNTLIQVVKSEILAKDLFSTADIETVQQGLAAVPKEGGTAYPFFNFTIPSAGKTGTAEFGHPQNKTHAWYTAYAPNQQPNIVATVLLEAGGEGSSVAAPVVKEMFTWYFNQDKSNIRSLDSAAVPDKARLLGE